MVGSLLRLYKKIGTDAKVWHLYRLIKCIETFSAASRMQGGFCVICLRKRILSIQGLHDIFNRIISLAEIAMMIYIVNSS